MKIRLPMLLATLGIFAACEKPKGAVQMAPGQPKPASPRAEKKSDPRNGIISAEAFALGGVGNAGVMSEGEKALRDFLKTKPEPQAFLDLYERAGLPGKLYVLLALQSSGTDDFERLADDYVRSDAEVYTMSGSTMSKQPMKRIVEEIRDGKYELAEDSRR